MVRLKPIRKFSIPSAKADGNELKIKDKGRIYTCSRSLTFPVRMLPISKNITITKTGGDSIPEVYIEETGFMKITLEVIGSLMILLSLLPLIKTHYWWIRVLDFPRMQIAFMAAVVLGFYLYFVPINHRAEILFAVLLTVALVNQLVHVYRYTWLSPVQALRSKLKSSPNSFSFMISNVRMSNRRYGRFLKIVAENAPDVLLINEPDQLWAEAISSLDAVYKYAIKKPLENTYGMIL